MFFVALEIAIALSPTAAPTPAAIFIDFLSVLLFSAS